MADKKEFITGWPASQPMIWAERQEEQLIGSSKGGHLLVPKLNVFDFIPAANTAVPILSAPSNRAFVDAPRGTQSMFHRNADFEALHFHMAGETTYETEFGVFKARPADLVLIPAGISHRATGQGGALRLSMQIRDPLEIKVDESGHIGHTEYDVAWQGAPLWADPPVAVLFPKGRVTESVHTWDEAPGEQTLVDREYERLVGSIKPGTAAKDPNAVHCIRLFDIFTEMTGKRGPGPISLINDNFFMECYNTVGEQFAYHRANRSDEAQLQFNGSAENINEFGTDIMDAGNLYIQRRGISHRVKGSPNYRRMVFYSREPWKLLFDPGQSLRQTSFQVSERVIESAPWREEIAQYLATALQRR
jgi:hypothetical protein